jgi:1-deoxy-D-xylulose-5-phosphate synthase
MSLLDGITSPRDVHELPEAQVPDLISEVRQRIIDVTLKNGGHMASSLGAVELIVALLRTFDADADRIIFDVGHQSYAWKILTGRNNVFDTLRCEGGVSGFPKMNESRYDHFGTGHSSTSLSAALGYAIARDLKKENHHVAAVIGDGALINGEAFEALNHAGSLNTPVIFILNDNAMSIGPRVGGMAMHLARLSTSTLYKGTKSVVKRLCRKIFRTNRVYNALERAKNHAKNLISGGNLFNDMGLTYWGPFDGHDEKQLEKVFRLAQRYDGPLLIHVITKKGKGYKPAEDNPVKYHGLPRADAVKSPAACSWSKAAAECIEKIAAEDPLCVVLTPAMTDGSALNHFHSLYPERFFDVGIAEEHMITLAAGLAAGGMHPVACIYSTFLQRAVDQLVHDVALQHLHVIIAVDRAGLTGEDGETHQGLFDMNWACVIPDLQVWAPFDRTSLKTAFHEAEKCSGPVLIRYPRGTVIEQIFGGRQMTLPHCSYMENNASWCVIGAGSSCTAAVDAQRAAAEQGIEVPSVFCLNRVDVFPAELKRFLSGKKTAVFVEESYERGGLGEHLAAICAAWQITCRVLPLAVPAQFIAQGTQQQQRKRCGLTAERIVELYEREKA